MFSFSGSLAQTDAQQASTSLEEEGKYRFPSFSSSDAVTLGLSIRKRFRASTRHAKGKGLVISIQTIAGHTLFSCTVGDLGHPSGVGDTSLDSWTCLEGMMNVVRRTGHSSFYVEKGMGAMGLIPKQNGTNGVASSGESRPLGGAFPLWLENAHVCPIAIAACYSGSSQDDHNLVVTTVRDFLNKMLRNSGATIAATSVLGAPTLPSPHIPTVPPPQTTEWPEYNGSGTEYGEHPYPAGSSHHQGLENEDM